MLSSITSTLRGTAALLPHNLGSTVPPLPAGARILLRTVRTRCSSPMHDSAYYRSQAERARRLAADAVGETQAALLRAAQSFDEMAEDLEAGAVEVRHPELLPA